MYSNNPTLTLESLEKKCLGHFDQFNAHDDPSHDRAHTERVLAVAKTIAHSEGANLRVVIPAAIFHDLINYRKNDPRSRNAVDESAGEACRFLDTLRYSEEQKREVAYAITTCSFSRGQRPSSIEAMCVKDADLLEQTGAIAIMRTFASCGQMNKLLLDPIDPFAKYREPDASTFALDLFPVRLLEVEKHLSTAQGRELCANRAPFLLKFLEQLRRELPRSEHALLC